jgi:hypothetical protein
MYILIEKIMLGMKNLKQLRAQAKGLGLRGYSKLRKSALISKIQKAQKPQESKKAESLVSSFRGGKKIDLGHMVINMYCQGSTHPDYPVPQSVVRTALNAQSLPSGHPTEQVIRNLVREEASQMRKNQTGIPLKAVAEVLPRTFAPPPPAPLPKTQIPRVFEPLRAPKEPSKKFPTVVPTVRNRPISFEDDDDDSDEEETASERARRLRMEQLASEMGQSKGKGKSGKFRKKLARALAGRL